MRLQYLFAKTVHKQIHKHFELCVDLFCTIASNFSNFLLHIDVTVFCSHFEVLYKSHNTTSSLLSSFHNGMQP